MSIIKSALGAFGKTFVFLVRSIIQIVERWWELTKNQKTTIGKIVVGFVGLTIGCCSFIFVAAGIQTAGEMAGVFPTRTPTPQVVLFRHSYSSDNRN